MSDTPARPVVVIVRDGWGHNPDPAHDAFNAVHLADTPVSDALLERFPHTRLHTCCRHVGLPAGTMGNSEVGHQNIGAGRVVNQESTRITVATEDGSFFENPALLDAARGARAEGRKLHLMGIASDAGVHGLMEHLYACVELARREGVPAQDVCLHLFTDGRDTGPFSGKGFLAEIEAKLEAIGVGRVVSLVGRYLAMDRDNRWERVQWALRPADRWRRRPELRRRPGRGAGLLRRPDQRQPARRRVRDPADRGPESVRNARVRGRRGSSTTTTAATARASWCGPSRSRTSTATFRRRRTRASRASTAASRWACASCA